MRRREFITLLGAAAAWPVVARAQQAMPVIGFLHSASLDSRLATHAAFHRGLGEAGFAEGRNVAIEYRWAENNVDQLPALAADLVRRRVDVIFAGGPPSATAAKLATATIPIVFTSGADPVKAGLVASLNKPGGNVTGVSLFYAQLGVKRLALLRELLMSKADVVAFLVNTTTVEGTSQLPDVLAAAHAAG